MICEKMSLPVYMILLKNPYDFFLFVGFGRFRMSQSL